MKVNNLKIGMSLIVYGAELYMEKHVMFCYIKYQVTFEFPKCVLECTEKKGSKQCAVFLQS